MASNILFSFKNPEIPKSRTVRITQDGKVINIGKNETGQQDQQKKELSIPRELSNQHLQSNKNINFNRIPGSNQQNKESREQMFQRQIRNAQNYHQEEMNKLVLSNKFVVQELQMKNRALDKEKNHWKELALKLKNDIENKTIGENNEKQIRKKSINQAENYQNKFFEEEIAKYKLMNVQLISDLTKLKQENKRLINQLNLSSKQSHPLIRIESPLKNTQRTSQSPIRFQNSESPLKNQSQSEVKHHHRRHHHQVENSINGSIDRDAQKEIEKLKKVCAKMEKIISQRNEELVKEKTKVLNMKYKNG